MEPLKSIELVVTLHRREWEKVREAMTEGVLFFPYQATFEPVGTDMTVTLRSVGTFKGLKP